MDGASRRAQERPTRRIYRNAPQRASRGNE
jgi:hypothetical protein